MGKSVDFCHIIIISAIITVYRTAGRPEFSARLYCTGRKKFSQSELQKVLQYYQVLLWIKKIRQQRENINFCKRIYFRHFAITFSFRKFASNALRMNKKKIKNEM